MSKLSTKQLSYEVSRADKNENEEVEAVDQKGTAERVTRLQRRGSQRDFVLFVARQRLRFN